MRALLKAVLGACCAIVVYVSSLACPMACAQTLADQDIFIAGQEGPDGAPRYRIPSIIQASDGSLLAFVQGRFGSGDPGRDVGGIALHGKRSIDRGQTWSDLMVILSQEDDQGWLWDWNAWNPVIVQYNAVTNERLALYSQVVRDIAGTESVPLIDVWNMYQDVVDGGGDVDDLLLDNAHPNGDGHALVADALFAVIASVGPPNGIEGDVNQDGSLFGNGTGLPATDDITAFRAGWRTTGYVGVHEMYTHGDMNFDGITDLRDAHILHDAFEAAGTPVSFDSLFDSAIPEPASHLLCVLCFGTLLMLYQPCRYRQSANSRLDRT